MRVAAVFLYAFLMMPVVLKIRLYTDDHTMIAGNIRLWLYCGHLSVPFRIKRREGVYVQIGLIPQMRLSVQLKKKNKSSVWLKREIKSWTNLIFFHMELGIGTGDACATALCCAAAQMLSSFVSCLISRISPFYDHAGYFLQVRGIAVFRLGKLFLTAAVIALDRMTAKRAGGRANGDRAKQTNQLRHADGP